MSKRPALPGAEELFRRTATPVRPDSTSAVSVEQKSADSEPVDELAPIAIEGGVRPVSAAPRRRRGSSRPTGRIRHEEKITVYVSPEELLELEHARLTLRGTHGLAVDRGRIVREAIAVVVADLEARGSESVIVRRLGGL
ncbi:MAG: hypothetical protein RIS75_1169 [Actinomycetota bacterium]|jgi:hypothetical protein